VRGATDCQILRLRPCSGQGKGLGSLVKCSYSVSRPDEIDSQSSATDNMVLNELASRLQKSFQDLGRSPSVDEKALDAALKEICTALLESDVNVKLVSNLRNKVKNRVLPSLQNEGSGVNKRNLIQRAVFDELVALVDADGSAAALAVTGPSTSAAATSSASAWKPKKGVSNVVMFVGLQGAGKTTSCTKVRHPSKAVHGTDALLVRCTLSKERLQDGFGLRRYISSGRF
jgi:signal recognition particle GTPase